MRLSRRDAIAALAALGAIGGVAIGADRLDRGEDEPDHDDDRAAVEILTAVAETVYPAEVSGIDEFVDSYLTSRLRDDAVGPGIRANAAELERLSVEWHGTSVTALSPTERDTLLREIGVDTASEVRDGTTAEGIRYYVVNELLLALYSSPKGGTLVGLENPQGHPGGVESYTLSSHE